MPPPKETVSMYILQTQSFGIVLDISAVFLKMKKSQFEQHLASFRAVQISTQRRHNPHTSSAFLYIMLTSIGCEAASQNLSPGRAIDGPGTCRVHDCVLYGE